MYLMGPLGVKKTICLQSINIQIILITNVDIQTDNIVLCTITVRADTEHEKSSCAPPNQYKAMLCTTKV